MTRESVETRSKRKQRAATKREKKRKYQARQRKVAEVCKVLTDPHTARALREGITREEAKMRNFGEQYGGGVRSGRMSASGRNLSSIPRSLKNTPFWLPKKGEVPKVRFLYDESHHASAASYASLYEHHTIGGKTHVACEALKKLAVDTETETFDPKNPNVFIGTDYGSVESRVMAMYSKIDAELTQGLVDVSWKGKRGRKKK